MALDPFPHTGHTTTCDAAWMGVPTMTLAGGRFMSRLGVSVLTTLGLEDLIADTPEGYIETAVMLARSRHRLAEIRAGLRATMDRSMLRDGPALARRVEAAYREMWSAWCGPEMQQGFDNQQTKSGELASRSKDV